MSTNLDLSASFAWPRRRPRPAAAPSLEVDVVCSNQGILLCEEGVPDQQANVDPYCPVPGFVECGEPPPECP